ncbi:MAG: dTMP kinase [Elusimicrobiota bacterium]|nr:dTMP kinase [Elusimicrobiota bacterium]
MGFGKFITLEGPEGSGKSTQARLLAGYITGFGREVVCTREPGGVSISEQLREILLDTESTIYPTAELLLYAAGRAQHTQEKIFPALKESKFVICERFTHASIAYQGYGRGLDRELIDKLNDIAAGGLKPDLTVILDIDVETGLKRARDSSGKLDRLESENVSFHKKVREGYLELAGENPDIEVVSSLGTRDKIKEGIIEILKRRNII